MVAGGPAAVGGKYGCEPPPQLITVEPVPTTSCGASLPPKPAGRISCTFTCELAPPAAVGDTCTDARPSGPVRTSLAPPAPPATTPPSATSYRTIHPSSGVPSVWRVTTVDSVSLRPPLATDGGGNVHCTSTQ